jgi:hypothetical protein
MDEDTARAVAFGELGDRQDRSGQPILQHVTRVASSVSAEARVVAWLHDVLERSALDATWLSDHGVTRTEVEAVLLLTRAPAESYELHTLQIAHATGVSGRLAREVKRADLEDHIAHRSAGAPTMPYAWALRHIRNAQAPSRLSA